MDLSKDIQHHGLWNVQHRTDKSPTKILKCFSTKKFNWGKSFYFHQLNAINFSVCLIYFRVDCKSTFFLTSVSDFQVTSWIWQKEKKICYFTAILDHHHEQFKRMRKTLFSFHKMPNVCWYTYYIYLKWWYHQYQEEA